MNMTLELILYYVLPILKCNLSFYFLNYFWSTWFENSSTLLILQISLHSPFLYLKIFYFPPYFPSPSFLLHPSCFTTSPFFSFPLCTSLYSLSCSFFNGLLHFIFFLHMILILFSSFLSPFLLILSSSFHSLSPLPFSLFRVSCIAVFFILLLSLLLYTPHSPFPLLSFSFAVAHSLPRIYSFLPFWSLDLLHSSFILFSCTSPSSHPTHSDSLQSNKEICVVCRTYKKTMKQHCTRLIAQPRLWWLQRSTIAFIVGLDAITLSYIPLYKRKYLLSIDFHGRSNCSLRSEIFQFVTEFSRIFEMPNTIVF